MINCIRLPYPIPYYAQVASPELACAIFEEGLDPKSDPCWQQWGCASAAEYAYWVDRACGIACVKMVVEGLGGPKFLMMEWIRDALGRNGYLITSDANGSPVERGWVHRALAELISAAGFQASARPAAIEEIAGFLGDGQVVIASVSYELGKDGPITRQGGHLVVVTGAEVTEEGIVDCFYINNPSGRLAKYQANARMYALQKGAVRKNRCSKWGETCVFRSFLMVAAHFLPENRVKVGPKIQVFQKSTFLQRVHEWTPDDSPRRTAGG